MPNIERFITEPELHNKIYLDNEIYEINKHCTNQFRQNETNFQITFGEGSV